jgi:hypothetical protein
MPPCLLYAGYIVFAMWGSGIPAGISFRDIALKCGIRIS